MTKSCIKKAAMAMVSVVALGMLPTVSSGGTRLPVTARIAAKCAVATGIGTLTFSATDPSRSAKVTATQVLVMKCSSGAISTAAIDDGGLHNVAGQMQMVHSADSTAFLPYSITYSSDAGFAGTGFGASAASQSVVIKGIITPAQFQNALVATGAQGYSDTITLTVNP